MPFISPYANLQVMLLNDRHDKPWITLEKLVYESPLSGETYEVKKHFRTDLASIPKALILFAPPLAARFFGRGVWMGARESALHDSLRTKDEHGKYPVPAHLAHKIFREALYEAGYPSDLCENYYSALMMFNSKD
jgi:hypothetical protein